MNFLAHLYLSFDKEGYISGNFIADMISNKEMAQLPADMQLGILLHREIDHFTDRHEEVLKGVHRLYPMHHKYAPVIVDVFYDYFLAKNWDKYSEESLQSFSERMFTILRSKTYLMPEKLQTKLSMMLVFNWLPAFGEMSGMAETFKRMRKRVSRPEYLDHVLESLTSQEELFDKEFNIFFPELIAFVKSKI